MHALVIMTRSVTSCDKIVSC